MRTRYLARRVGLASIAFALPTWAAVPSVTGVSGTVATGSTLTVTGSNLVNEDVTSWMSFFKSGTNPSPAGGFEGSSPTADGYFFPGAGSPQANYLSSVKLLGNQSVRFHVAGASTSIGNQLGATMYHYPPATNDVWVRAYVRWDYSGGWPDNHVKMFWTPLGMLFQPGSGGDCAFPTQMNVFYDGQNHCHTIPSPIESGRWYEFEAHLKTTGGAKFEVYWEGNLLESASPSSVGSGSLSDIDFGVVNACCTTAGFSLDHYWDGFVMSSTRVRPASMVEIGTSAAYGAGVKYQAPLSLADATVAVKADLTGLGAGPYYLWVTNNRGERSAAFALSGTGGSGGAGGTSGSGGTGGGGAGGTSAGGVGASGGGGTGGTAGSAGQPGGGSTGTGATGASGGTGAVSGGTGGAGASGGASSGGASSGDSASEDGGCSTPPGSRHSSGLTISLLLFALSLRRRAARGA
ncbi:MAG: hypothetical protein U0263_11860 [Polyangiaceae bacterium]